MIAELIKDAAIIAAGLGMGAALAWFVFDLPRQLKLQESEP